MVACTATSAASPTPNSPLCGDPFFGVVPWRSLGTDYSGWIRSPSTLAWSPSCAMLWIALGLVAVPPLELELVAEGVSDGLQDSYGLLSDFGTDAVAGEDG